MREWLEAGHPELGALDKYFAPSVYTSNIVRCAHPETLEWTWDDSSAYAGGQGRGASVGMAELGAGGGGGASQRSLSPARHNPHARHTSPLFSCSASLVAERLHAVPAA